MLAALAIIDSVLRCWSFLLSTCCCLVVIKTVPPPSSGAQNIDGGRFPLSRESLYREIGFHLLICSFAEPFQSLFRISVEAVDVNDKCYAESDSKDDCSPKHHEV